MSAALAFVAGATGYTGREVVAALRARGLRTVAHVRPGSSRLEEWRARFEALGAEVDATPWEPAAMSATFARLAPSQVYALLGTTAKRARGEGRSAVAAYESVDYGLSKQLIDAAVSLDDAPRFVYLSSQGVEPGTRNPYLAARARVEAELSASALPYLIARPSFITGADRDEARPAERWGAAAADLALGALGALGARRLRERFASTDARTLARALVHWGCAEAPTRRILSGAELRSVGS